MKESFRAYYRPTDTEFKRLWKTAVVSVDANVLLDLFRFSEATSNALFATLEAVEDRIWLSHQAVLEYHRNLPTVMANGATECAAVLKSFEDLELRLVSTPNKKRTRPHISAGSLQKFQRIKTLIKREVEKERSDLLDQMGNHPLKERIASLFKSKVGKASSQDELERLYKEGKARFERHQAPGCSDLKKPEPERYGDWVLWRQIMDHCKATKSDLIFVTNDQKEDWFHEIAGKTLGPLPTLVSEFFEVTGRQFYAYSVAHFLERANSFLDAGISKEAIAEAKTPPPVIGTINVTLDSGTTGNQSNLYEAPTRLRLDSRALASRELLREANSLEQEARNAAAFISSTAFREQVGSIEQQARDAAAFISSAAFREQVGAIGQQARDAAAFISSAAFREQMGSIEQQARDAAAFLSSAAFLQQAGSVEEQTRDAAAYISSAAFREQLIGQPAQRARLERVSSDDLRHEGRSIGQGPPEVERASPTKSPAPSSSGHAAPPTAAPRQKPPR